ncbi:MAG: succinate dehydrogenase iron-sulfur subunit [Chitinispirillaceae bacterium]|nr:succinate dehydrogenase iron-sulfur subunit [Chitinispirillaceae bacterium]
MRYTFKIFRFNPAADTKPYYVRYQLDAQESWSIVNCLTEIRASQDSTLAFRRSCRNGICGSCAMNINRKNRLACETLLGSIRGRTVTIKPLPYFEIIRDLVVDFSSFFKTLEAIHPFCHGGSREENSREIFQSPAQRKKLDGLYECIACGSCTSACPSFWHNDTYPGPAMLLKAFRFVVDSRDEIQKERLRALDCDNSVWRCHTIFNCAEACPKGLNPTKAIQELKRLLTLNKICG